MSWQRGSPFRATIVLLAFGVVPIAVACTPDEGALESTSTTNPPSTIAAPEATNTVTQPPAALGDLLRSHLSASDFSATVSISVVSTRPIGTISSSGAGSVSGSDSEMALRIDLSGLTGTFVDQYGRLIGEDGVSETSQATKVVGGVQYRQDDGGRWRVSNLREPQTALGHVFDIVRDAPVFDDVGTEVIDGHEFTVMAPTAAVVYDPAFFDLDPEEVSQFDADTFVLVDDDGAPVRIALMIVAEIDAGETTMSSVFEITYDLTDVGSTGAIEAPPRAWVSLTSMDFGVGDVGVMLADMDVPEEYTLDRQAEGAFDFFGPDDDQFRIRVSYLDDKTPADDVLALVLEGTTIELDSVTEPDFSTFPSRLATDEMVDGQYVMVYVEVQLGRLVLAVVSIGSVENSEQRRADFEDTLRTITWLNPDDHVVPGETLANLALQGNALLGLESSYPDCDEQVPIWTDLVSGDLEGWTEDWYFNACGAIEIFEIRFIETEFGAVMAVSDPRGPGERP